MRIAREIIETLKMELRFLKYNNIELNITSLEKEVNLNIKTRVGGFSFNLPSIFDTAFSKSSFNVLSITQKNESKFNIVSIEKFDADIREINFEDVTNYHEITFKNDVKIQDVRDHSQNLEEKMNIYSALKTIANPKIYSEKPFSRSVKLKSIGFIPKKISVKSNKFKSLLCSYYIPCDYVEKDKLLAVLSILRNKYDISKMKFYAYYKDIPLEISLAVKIAPSRELFVQFDERKWENRSLRENLNLRNLIVFRYDDKFLYYPI